MRKLIIAVLILKLSLAAATETIICQGSEESYQCFRYDGGEYERYDYPSTYLSNVINVHEFNDNGTGNPDAGEYDSGASSESSDGGQNQNDYPVFIPFLGPPFIFAR
jgi:hypothetical protein